MFVFIALFFFISDGIFFCIIAIFLVSVDLILEISILFCYVNTIVIYKVVYTRAGLKLRLCLVKKTKLVLALRKATEDV